MSMPTFQLNFETFADNLPPQNVDAEESILGGILLDPEAIGRVADILAVDAFYINSHKSIYKVALHLHTQGKPTDLMSVASYLHDQKLLEQVGGQAKLAQMVDRTVSAVNIDRYAELVMEKFLRRQLISLGNQLIKCIYDQSTDTQSIVQDFQETFDELKGTLKKEDKDLIRYNCLIKKLGDIELSDIDPGAKAFKRIDVSKEFRISSKDLENIYFKSLIDKDNEPLQTLEELFNKYSDTERQWLIQGLLPKGITAILHARGGVGKTLLAYDIARKLITGQDFDQFTVTAKKRKVLIVQTDESPEDLTDRLRKVGFTSDQLDIKVKTRWTFDHVCSLRKEIEKERPDFVIIDSITSCSKNSIVSENEVAYAKPVLLLNEIAAEFGCSILMIHHSSYEGNARGTTALFNAVGLVLRLETDPRDGADPLERILTFQKARSRSTGKYRLKLSWEDNSWSVLQEEGENPDGAAASTKAAIFNYLASRRGVMFEAEELSQELGYSKDNIRREAGQLAGAGIISMRDGSKGRPSKYFLPRLKGDSDCKNADHSDRSPKNHDQNQRSANSYTEQGIQNADHSDHENREICSKNLCEISKNSDQNDQHFETHTQSENLLIMDSDQHFETDVQSEKMPIAKIDHDQHFPEQKTSCLETVPENFYFTDLKEGDCITTKSGKLTGWITKLTRYKGKPRKVTIVWSNDKETINTIEEMNMARYRKVDETQAPIGQEQIN